MQDRGSHLLVSLLPARISPALRSLRTRHSAIRTLGLTLQHWEIADRNVRCNIPEEYEQKYEK